MKKLKSLSVVLFACITLSSLSSCKKDKDEEINRTNQTFITMAASNNSFQQAAANLARSKSQSADVVSYGASNSTMQSELGAAIKNIAQTNNWIIPSNLEPREQAHLDMLNNLSVEAFDREYANIMVQVSNDAVDLYTDGNGNGVASPGLRAFAAEKLMAMKTQLTAAEALRAKVN